MSIHRLEVFVFVAKHRHISHAAKELHISQPSVSRHLKLLEDEFGVNLYRKTSQGVELTPEGKEFLKGAESVVFQYYQRKAAFKNGNNNDDTEHFRVGASFRPPISHLPELLTSFSRFN